MLSRGGANRRQPGRLPGATPASPQNQSHQTPPTLHTPLSSAASVHVPFNPEIRLSLWSQCQVGVTPPSNKTPAGSDGASCLGPPLQGYIYMSYTDRGLFRFITSRDARLVPLSVESVCMSPLTQQAHPIPSHNWRGHPHTPSEMVRGQNLMAGPLAVSFSFYTILRGAHTVGWKPSALLTGRLLWVVVTLTPSLWLPAKQPSRLRWGGHYALTVAYGTGQDGLEVLHLLVPRQRAFWVGRESLWASQASTAANGNLIATRWGVMRAQPGLSILYPVDTWPTQTTPTRHACPARSHLATAATGVVSRLCQGGVGRWGKGV